jgi:hypothetical protein
MDVPIKTDIAVPITSESTGLIPKHSWTLGLVAESGDVLCETNFVGVVLLRRGYGFHTHNRITSSRWRGGESKAATAARGENMTDILMEYIKAYVEKYSSKRRRR